MSEFETAEQRKNRERLRELFDAVADDYEAGRARYPDALLSRLIGVAGLTDGCRVLEAGCGTGLLTRQLVRHGLSVVAVDHGPSLIAVAKERVASERAEFVTTTFEDYHVPDGSFDLVASAAAWHWLDPAICWEKAARLLRPGGWLAIIDNGQEYEEPVATTLWGLIERATGWTPPPVDPGRDRRGDFVERAREWFARCPRPELFGDVVADVVIEQTILSSELLVRREMTRAGFLELDDTTQSEFVRDLKAALNDRATVRLLQLSYLAMAPVR